MSDGRITSLQIVSCSIPGSVRTARRSRNLHHPDLNTYSYGALGGARSRTVLDSFQHSVNHDLLRAVQRVEPSRGTVILNLCTACAFQAAPAGAGHTDENLTLNLLTKGLEL